MVIPNFNLVYMDLKLFEKKNTFNRDLFFLYILYLYIKPLLIIYVKGLPFPFTHHLKTYFG